MRTASLCIIQTFMLKSSAHFKTFSKIMLLPTCTMQSKALSLQIGWSCGTSISSATTLSQLHLDNHQKHAGHMI